MNITVSGLNGSGLVLQNSEGDDLAVASNGLKTFSKRLASGSAYAISVKSRPRSPLQTCTVSNGTGNVASENVTNITVTCADVVSRFAYSPAGPGWSTVSAYKVESTGALTSLTPATVSAPGGPWSSAVDPAGRFLYIGSDTSVYRFRIDGAVSPVGVPDSRTTINSGNGTRTVAVHPNGKFVYAVNFFSDDIAVFNINAVDGSLSSAGPPVPTGQQCERFFFDPTATFAYTICLPEQKVYGYRVNGDTGALTPLGEVLSVSSGGYAIATHPEKRILYAVDPANNMSAYAINSDGSLSLIGAGVPSSAAFSLVVEPNGKYVYAVNGAAIRVYSVNTDGSLSFTNTVNFGTGMAYQITSDAAGKFIYVAHTTAARIRVYRIDPADGNLINDVPGSPYVVSGTNSVVVTY
ncbi:MAG TPA: beta-propeller fold lactonase family protein [Noviherbaspirillum sp.]|uniref:lactonase family protein n=1 Tax=Noviherbaspirillum sp. TaxID=1926288 RepID=UPI002F92DA51